MRLLPLSLWLIWGFLLWGTLQIANISLPFKHGICGVWGCGPPVEALLACHFSWVMVLVPIAWIYPEKVPRFRLRLTAGLLIAVAAFVFLAIIAQEWMTWYASASESVRRYFLQRIGFVVACSTDYPMLQLFVLGCYFNWRSRRECQRIGLSSTEKTGTSETEA